MSIKQFFKLTVLICLIPLLGIVGAAELSASPGMPTRIESLEFVPRSRHQLRVGAGLEFNRELGTDLLGEEELEYDAYRLSPVEYRFGLLDDFELGIGTGYTMNSGSPHPDESNFDTIDLMARMRWHRYFGTSFRLRFAGDPALHPDGADRPQLRVNFPFVIAVGDGYFHSEVGYTFAGGDYENAEGEVIADREGHLNYGLGLSWANSSFSAYSLEVVGRQAGAELESGSFNDHLELVFGSTFTLNKNSRLQPSIAVGLLEGSPDLALRISYTLGLEPPLPTRKKMLPADRFSRRDPAPVGEPEVDLHELKNRGAAEFELNNLEKAIEIFEEVLEHKPDSLIALSNLGGLHYRRENYSRAAVYYRRALDVEPTDVVARQYLGAIYYQLGEWEEAREEFQTVLELEPDNETVQRWLDFLSR